MTTGLSNVREAFDGLCEKITKKGAYLMLFVKLCAMIVEMKKS